MVLKKGDFISVDFTGKIKDGGVFDSTIKEELEKLHKGHDHLVEAKPLVFCLGQGMFLETLDDFLIGKEIGEYEIELTPEKSFGVRDSSMIRMIPIKVFQEQKINPIPGASLNFDGRVGKVLTVSGGRVMIDFNHPLAGKTVVYKINVLRVISDMNEKIKAVNEFFFRRDFKFEIADGKLVIEAEKQFVRVIELFKDKFKEMLGLDLKVKEIGEKKEEKTIEKSQN